MMKEELYFINKGNNCSPKIPTRFTNYLDKNNFLSEFQSEESKLNVKDNLGITLDLTTIKNLIDRKVIESGDIAWDLIPTEGNTENVLSSDALYKAFLKYVTKEELDRLLQELYTNVNDKIERLDNLYNSLEEHLLNTLEEKLNELMIPYLEQIDNLTQLVYSFLKSSGKNALSKSFGDSDYIGVSQKSLTSAINRIWLKLEDITGEVLQGIDMAVTPTFFISEEGCNIHISANTVEINGTFEKIQFFVDNNLIYEDTNTEYVSFDHQLNVKNEYYYVIMCKAKIMGIEYTRQKIVTRYNEFYIGSGSTYNDIINSTYVRQLNGTMRHNYNINFNEGDKLIIVMGTSLKDGFMRADLNGVEIKFTEEIVTIDNKDYVVFTSDGWSEGEYNIDING